MSDILKEWFKAYNVGLTEPDDEERKRVFKKSAENCADAGMLRIYEQIFQESNNDLDLFFSNLNKLETISGKVKLTGKVYEIVFPKCYCELHTSGVTDSAILCECSRQSILYVMQTLNDKLKYEVEKITTVLEGAKECRFRIAVI